MRCVACNRAVFLDMVECACGALIRRHPHRVPQPRVASGAGFLIGGDLAFLAAFGLFVASKRAMHEIAAVTMLGVGAVLAVGGSVERWLSRIRQGFWLDATQIQADAVKTE
jgi:hypothetical protein